MTHQLIKKVLVAINGNENSIHAAMYAIMLCKQLGFELKVIYVIDTATLNFLSYSKFLISEEKNQYEKDIRADGLSALSYVEKLAKSKGLKIETELCEGGVCSSILSCAEKYEADIIMLGGSENSGKYIESDDSRRSIHSTARTEIVRYAKCPVMVIHQPGIESLFKIFK